MTTYTIWIPNLSDQNAGDYFSLLPPRFTPTYEVDGATGRDAWRLSPGNDWALGADGDDTIGGKAGDDLLEGGKGDDVLRGGADNDIVTGGRGDDRLYGGEGADILVGGKGKDTFHVSGDGGDLIADFEPGVDRIVIDGKRVSLHDLERDFPDVVIATASEATSGVPKPGLHGGVVPPHPVDLHAASVDLLL